MNCIEIYRCRIENDYLAETDYESVKKQLIYLYCSSHNIVCNLIADFREDKNGRPFITKGSLYLSISNKNNYIILCFSQYSEVGIDMEKIATFNQQISDRFFSEEEKQYLSNCHNSDYLFYRLWTMKESYAKITGSTLVESLKNSFVDNNNIQNTCVFKSKIIIFNSFDIDDYMITICSYINKARIIFKDFYYNSGLYLINRGGLLIDENVGS